MGYGDKIRNITEWLSACWTDHVRSKEKMPMRHW